MKKPFKLRLKLHKSSKIGYLRNLTFNNMSWYIFLQYRSNPRVLGHLLDTKGNPLLVSINLYNNAFYLVAFLNCFARMIIFPRPAQIRNMYHPVNALFYLHKYTEICNTANRRSNNCTRRILL